MNTLLVVALIFEAVVGVGAVLAPGPVFGPFGARFDDHSRAFARLFGSALVGLAVVLGCALRFPAPELRTGVAWGISVYYLVSAVILAALLRKGQMKPAGWGLVGLHVVLAAGFLYVLAAGPTGAA